jgi:hypothetical protein
MNKFSNLIRFFDTKFSQNLVKKNSFDLRDGVAVNLILGPLSGQGERKLERLDPSSSAA